ncbi:dihydrofolate reductase isoform X2 [Hetaerina americana]|uniref:dihydrofolate reductase isoform X2 n=1 Tax=Hetaerina americana TaxID=62018 RepID=UPI003A7F42C9
MRYFSKGNMGPNLNLIVAVCENMGIGFKGELPWKLKSEMAYFSKMTKGTKDPSKKNAVIMGRKTWESIPKKFKPLPDRINVVLSTNKIEVAEGVLLCSSLEGAVAQLRQPPFNSVIETVWVIGGSSLYKASMDLPECHRLYLTHIKAMFECDTFFPTISPSFKVVSDPNVPQEVQEENGIKYEYKSLQSKN